MNNEISAYTIGVIGFERPERHALRRVVAMADGRQPAFKPFDKGRDDGCPHLPQHEIDATMGTTIVPASSPATTPAESDEGSQTQRSREINALVVDDSMSARVQMRAVLSPIASRMDFAETGERALELIDVHRYSVIFLDSTLPDWDTYELCERIKKNALQGEAVLVMVTSQSSPADRVMGVLAGFDNFLIKPIQSTKFNDLVAELVRPAAAI
jgi:CheY-like chemotaxis protein